MLFTFCLHTANLPLRFKPLEQQRTFNIAGGETRFDTQETKLPTYWNTPVSKICLGVKIGEQLNFVVIDKHADSLHSLFTDGQYRATSLEEANWFQSILADSLYYGRL